MVKYSSTGLDSTFSALADPIRRALLQRLLREGELPVVQLAKPFDVSLPAISKHLGVLERAGFVKRRVEGRVHKIRFSGEPLQAAAEFINSYRTFWERRLERLENHFRTVNKPDQ